MRIKRIVIHGTHRKNHVWVEFERTGDPEKPWKAEVRIPGWTITYHTKRNPCMSLASSLITKSLRSDKSEHLQKA